MTFVQIEFLLFFVVLWLFLKLCSNFTVKKVLLLVASYYFYAYWDLRFLTLIWVSTIADYMIGLKLSQTENKQKRIWLLRLSLVINLGVLFFFKYLNFFVASFQALLAPTQIHSETLNIILPVGISFYTFQTLSYTIDVYRQKLQPCTNLLDFSLFVAFFPQLVAGPIVRASHFLPQLQKQNIITKERVIAGFTLFSIGLFKKVFVADRLALFVDEVYLNAGVYDGTTVFLATTAYAIQILCDFSGYSHMAIGLAKMMGFDFPDNFNFPYIAKNLSEFWQRWHISLSSWLRDYLYIPLGGNRQGKTRMYFNLFLTMLLGGLWHGASLNFVVWGAIHGAALVVARIFSAKVLHIPDLLRWLLTMFVVFVAWIFFRTQTLADAMVVISQIFLWKSGVAWLPPFPLFIIITTITIHIVKKYTSTDFFELPADRWYTPTIVFCLLWLVILFYPSKFQPFIYFQF